MLSLFLVEQKGLLLFSLLGKLFKQQQNHDDECIVMNFWFVTSIDFSHSLFCIRNAGKYYFELSPLKRVLILFEIFCQGNQTQLTCQ